MIWKLTRSSDAIATTVKPVPMQGRIEAAVLTNVLGDGPVAIVEFSDFECPFCAVYANKTFPEVKRALIATRKVRYASFSYPLDSIHPSARAASEAAECAARQGNYWMMHDRLFADPSSLQPEAYVRHAVALNLDPQLFADCVAGQATLKIREEVAEGRRLGVNGTPEFFIGVARRDGSIELRTRFTGAVDFGTLQAEVTRLLAN
jgi:protein-disulfide isomerase